MECACTHICFCSCLMTLWKDFNRADNPQKKVGLFFQVWVSTVAVWFPDHRDLLLAKMLQAIFLFFPQNELQQNLLSKFSQFIQASTGPRPGVDSKQYTGCLQRDSHGSLAHQPVAGQMGWPQCWAGIRGTAVCYTIRHKGWWQKTPLGKGSQDTETCCCTSPSHWVKYLIKWCELCLLMSGGY